MILHLLIFSLIILPLASKAMNCEMAYQKKIEDAQDFVANGSAMVVAGTVLKRMQLVRVFQLHLIIIIINTEELIF